MPKFLLYHAQKQKYLIDDDIFTEQIEHAQMFDTVDAKALQAKHTGNLRYIDLEETVVALQNKIKLRG